MVEGEQVWLMMMTGKRRCRIRYIGWIEVD